MTQNIIFWARELIEVFYTVSSISGAIGSLGDVGTSKYELSSSTLICFIASTGACYIFEQYVQYKLWRIEDGMSSSEGEKRDALRTWARIASTFGLLNVSK